MPMRHFLTALVSFVAVAAIESNAAEPVFTEWSSTEGKPAVVRIGTTKPQLAKDEAIEVIVEMKNNSKEPISLVRKPVPNKEDVRLFTVIRNGSKIEFKGSLPARQSPRAESFLVLRPGEVVKQTVTINDRRFRGIEAPGDYELKYRYSFPGYRFIAERLGFKDFFVGDVESPVLKITRAE